MWFQKKVKKVDVIEKETLKDIKKIKSKRFSNELINELHKIFRIYLEEKFKVKQGLTYEEMTKKVKSKKINHDLKEKIMFLEAEIYSIEYLSGEFNKKKSKLLIEKLVEIVRFKEEKSLI